MIIFLVQAGQEHGIGHLKRAISMAGLIKQDTHILIETALVNIPDLEPLLKKQAYSFVSSRQTPDKIEGLDHNAIDLIIYDRRRLTQAWVDYCNHHGIPQIAWDAYGHISESMEALINPLFYHQKKNGNFNEISYQYVDMSILKRPRKISPYDIMIAFGGSDPGQAALAIIKDIISLDLSICLIEGPLSDYSWASGLTGVDVVKKPANLLPYIDKSDVVITSVGLTLIEALQLNKKCIVFSPGIYHDSIAQQCQFAINGGLISRYQPGHIKDLLQRDLPHNSIMVLKNYKLWWNGLIEQVQSKGAAKCPVCGSNKRNAMNRYEDRTLFECKDCSSNYLYRFAGDSQVYQADYFQGHYKSVYGKDYMDDEKQIRGFSQRRLSIISDLHVHSGRDRLLDFGSAFGIFCDEAHVLGYHVQGVEISEYARHRAKELFDIDSSSVWPPEGDTWDVISAWFTLEHIQHPDGWLKQANTRLNKNGILALGLPHSKGALARWNKTLYKEIRPYEHEFEPSLAGISHALEKNGFHIEKVEYFGLHPDRIGWPDIAFMRAIQKGLGLGDTFEIYARKISAPR